MKFTTIEEVLEYFDELDTEVLHPTGLEQAIIGIVERFGMQPVILLDREKCIDILVKRDGMTEEEADEFFEYNIIGAWMGEGTPCFATLIEKKRETPGHKLTVKVIPAAKPLDCQGIDSETKTGKLDCSHPFIYREYIGQTPGKCVTCKRIVP